MELERDNAWTVVRGAPAWLLDNLRRHLSVPLDGPETPKKRFSRVWCHEGQFWGCMVHSTASWGRRDALPCNGRVSAGLTPHIEYLAAHYGVPCEVRDVRHEPSTGYPYHSVSGVDWRPYQEEIHRRIVQEGTGVVVALPRAGKTLMAVRAVDTIALPAVYIAPTVSIVRQTYDVFCEQFGMDMVARLDGSAKPEERLIHKPIVIATAISASKQSADWWQTRQMLVIDEFHHSAAETYHLINEQAAHIYHRLCFTGTHFRTGDDALAMQAICSNVLHEVGLAELVPKYLATPEVHFLPSDGARVSGALDYQTVYQKGIVESEGRNAKIVALAEMLMGHGEAVIVLVRRRAHADLLGKLIPDSVVVKGGEAVLTSNAVRDFIGGRYQCLIGTTVIGEGVDVPRASALIYASGGNDGVLMLQSYFRPLTGHEGKDRARIYDFVDLHNRTLRQHSERRLAAAQRFFGAHQVNVR